MTYDGCKQPWPWCQLLPSSVSSQFHSLPYNDQDHVVAGPVWTMWSIIFLPSPHCGRGCSSPLRKNSKGPGNLFIRKSCGSRSCLAEALTSPILFCIFLPSDIFSCSLAYFGESQVCKSRPQESLAKCVRCLLEGERGE